LTLTPHIRQVVRADTPHTRCGSAARGQGSDTTVSPVRLTRLRGTTLMACYLRASVGSHRTKMVRDF